MEKAEIQHLLEMNDSLANMPDKTTFTTNITFEATILVAYLGIVLCVVMVS